MANINHLEMAGDFSALPQIEIKKSFFGLKTNITYIPTHSNIHVVQNEYDSVNGEHMEDILLAVSPEKIKELISSYNIVKSSIGKVRVDACISEDKQFVAAQVLQFVDFNYVPVTDMKVFEGQTAEAIASIL